MKRLLYIFLFSILYFLTSCSNEIVEDRQVSPEKITIGDFTYKKFDSTKDIIYASLKMNQTSVLSDEKETYQLESYTGTSEIVVVESSFVYENITYEVSRIGHGVFENDKNIKTLTINEGISYIDYGSIRDCPNLINLNLPNTLTAVGSAAISNLGITELVLPNSNFYAKESSFESNAKLETVRFGHSSDIEISFLNCPNLKNLYITSELNSIDKKENDFDFLKNFIHSPITNVYIEGYGHLSFKDGSFYYDDKILVTYNK